MLESNSKNPLSLHIIICYCLSVSCNKGLDMGFTNTSFNATAQLSVVSVMCVS
jgi:hypothetical protein